MRRKHGVTEKRGQLWEADQREYNKEKKIHGVTREKTQNIRLHPTLHVPMHVQICRCCWGDATI